MAELRYEMPSSIEELAACLDQADPQTRVLGGGTDLLPRFHGRIPTGTTLIDLRDVADLAALTVKDGVLKVGANVTYSRICQDAFIRRNVPCLAEMAEGVGSLQIRNAACLPGNLANASPGGDAIGVLMALDAKAVILQAKGSTRTLAIPDLIHGIGRTDLARNEAIIAIEIPVPSSPRSGFGKIGMGARKEVVIANVSLSMVFDFDEKAGTITGARIVVGSAAPKAYRALAVEARCVGQRPSPELAGTLAVCLVGEVHTSIRGNTAFTHKQNDVKGLALDLFHRIFNDWL